MANQPMYERLSNYVKERGVFRKKIAAGAGISESQLSLLLNGKRRLTVEMYERLCAALAVSPAKFFQVEKQGKKN